MRPHLTRLVGGATWATLVVAIGLWFGREHPRIELVSNFRPHLFVATVLTLPFVAAIGLRRQAMVLVAATAVQGAAVVPYLVGGAPPAPDDAVRVLQYNVLYSNDDHDAIVDEILSSDAAVVGLHELTTDQWVAIEDRLRPEYPYSIVHAVDLSGRGSRGGGKAILSKAPLTEESVEGDFTWPRGPLAAQTTLGGEDVLIVAVHPSPSRTNGWFLRERARMLGATIEVIERVGLPAVVITDLNVTPTSHVYSDLLETLEWNDPRLGVGVAPTYPSGRLRHFGVSIDHVLVSPDFAVHEYQLGSGGGSDHRSLTAVISWRHPSAVERAS